MTTAKGHLHVDEFTDEAKEALAAVHVYGG